MSSHVADDDGVRVVEIRNPSRMNALTKPMLVDLARAFDERPRETSCVVLVGDDASMSFCAGIDLRAVGDVFATDEGEIGSDPVRAMEACDCPIVGAAHGACVNAGFEILLACDVVVASRDAVFVDTHAKTLMKLKCFEKVRIHIAVTEGKAGDKYLEVKLHTAAQPIEKDQVIGRKHVQENQPSSLPPKNKKSKRSK